MTCSLVQSTISILPSGLNVQAFATLKGVIVLSIGGYLWPAIKHGPWYCSPPSLGWSVFLTNRIAGVVVFFFGVPFHPFLAGCFPISLPFPCPPFPPLPPPLLEHPVHRDVLGAPHCRLLCRHRPGHLQSHCLGCRVLLPRSSGHCLVRLQLALDFQSSWLPGLWWPGPFGLAPLPPCWGFLPVPKLVLVGRPPI